MTRSNGFKEDLSWKNLFLVSCQKSVPLKNLEKLSKLFSDLKEIENGTDWEMKNNLGVCNFHRLNILESVEQYESSLQSQILKTGVLSPQIIFPVQRNLFTLNEMYKK